MVFRDQGIHNKGSKTYYEDLNGNGESELIRLYQMNPEVISLPIYKANTEIIDQYNIKGREPYNYYNNLISDDYDGNGNKEFYLFTSKKDTIFLNGISPFEKKHFINHFVVDYCSNGKSGYDWWVENQMYDVNGDGYKDLVFMLSTGFGIYPRRIYIYDIHNTTLKKSTFLGSGINGFIIDKFANNGETCILVSNTASANMRNRTQKFHDGNAYLFILNDKLELEFEPEVYQGETQSVTPFPLSFNGHNYWCIYNSNNKRKSEYGYRISLYDKNLTKLIEKIHPFEGVGMDMYCRPFNWNGINTAFIIRYDGTLMRLEKDLSLSTVLNFPEPIRAQIIPCDIDQDGKKELIAFNFSCSKCFVIQNNLKSFESITLPGLSGKIRAIAMTGKYNKPSFHVQIGNHFFDIIYKKTSNFYIKVFGIILGIYTGLLLLVRIIQFLTVGRERRRKRLAELQLTNWKNQLDPHFTFNTLNSVGAVILSEDRDKAYDFFTRFSKLVRYALEASNKVSVSIEDEIHFIELYLQLEQFRFNDKFDYTIDVSKEINRFTQVPKMLLQTYVENAVRHGLMDRDNKGILKINIFKEEEYLIFEVNDNGIGRIASNRKRRLSNGIGMKAMTDYFELLNSINYKNISLDINDSDDNNIKYPGTIVTIKIPEDFSYEL